MKNYFYFNRSQRIGTITLCVLIILSMVVYVLLPYIFAPPKRDNTELEKFKEEIRLFEQELKKCQAEEIANKEKYWKEKYQNQYPNYKERPKSYTKTNYTLFAFDPNTADSVDFINLGISTKIASNILKYRNAGGKFRNVDQFSKIYGITTEKFNELKPYISILAERKDTTTNNEVVVFERKYSEKKDTIIELNSADTTVLKLIRGIGSGYAKSIVYYRNSLGGYHHIEQLKEIKYLRPETYEMIKNSFTIDTTLIRKININTASVEYLERHPYLNFYQAKEIYELRRRKSQINSIEQLYDLEELDRTDVERIRPYLSFEKRKERKRKH